MIRTMTVFALAATITSVAAPVIADSPAPLDKAFGNTIVSTYPDGRKAELWLRSGGTYAATGRKGDASSGRWSVKGDKVCLKQVRPFGAPFSFCTPIPTGGVGSSWTAKAVTGERLSVSLVKGL
jgi:hypothetical protein